MHRITTRFGLIVTVAVWATAKLAAQQAPATDGGEEAAVKRVVDGISSRTWPRNNVAPVATYGGDPLISERSSRFLYTAIATSSRMERLPTRALRSRAKLW